MVGWLSSLSFLDRQQRARVARTTRHVAGTSCLITGNLSDQDLVEVREGTNELARNRAIKVRRIQRTIFKTVVLSRGILKPTSQASYFVKAYRFAQPDLEAIAKMLAEAATHAELTGLFRAAHLTEPSESEGLAKWKRIYNPLAIAQNRTQTGNFVLRFIQLVISPKRFADRSTEYEMLGESANRLLAFHGWILNEEAKFVRVEPAVRR